MNPDQIAKNGTEHAIQSAFFAWCNMAKRYGLAAADDEKSYTLRGWADKHYIHDKPMIELEWIHAIPNGGSRGDNAKSRVIQGGMLKAEGVKPGIPDIFLPIGKGGFHGMYIEMKTLKGSVSVNQSDFYVHCHNNSYHWVCCRSWEAARYEVIKYLNLSVDFVS